VRIERNRQAKEKYGKIGSVHKYGAILGFPEMHAPLAGIGSAARCQHSEKWNCVAVRCS